MAAGTTVHAISREELPWVYRARRPGRSRYIHRKASMATVTRTKVMPVIQ